MTREVTCIEKKKEGDVFFDMTDVLNSRRRSQGDVHRWIGPDKEEYLNIVLREQHMLWCFAFLIVLLYFSENGAIVLQPLLRYESLLFILGINSRPFQMPSKMIAYASWSALC